MNREDIKKYLHMLGQELQKQDVTGQILLADGVVMLLDVRKPKIRKDIDAYLKGDKTAIHIPKDIDSHFGGGGATIREAAKSIASSEGSEDVDTYYLSDFVAITKAAAVVAEREGLKDSWLNSAAAGFTHFFVRQPDRKLWKKFPGLHVYTASLDYIFVSKLLAHRFKDEADITALAERLGLSQQEDALALLEKYVPKDDVPRDVLDEIEELFGP